MNYWKTGKPHVFVYGMCLGFFVYAVLSEFFSFFASVFSSFIASVLFALIAWLLKPKPVSAAGVSIQSGGTGFSVARFPGEVLSLTTQKEGTFQLHIGGEQVGGKGNSSSHNSPHST